jgi:hypothetical protein
MITLVADGKQFNLNQKDFENYFQRYLDYHQSGSNMNNVFMIDFHPDGLEVIIDYVRNNRFDLFEDFYNEKQLLYAYTIAEKLNMTELTNLLRSYEYITEKFPTVTAYNYTGLDDDEDDQYILEQMMALRTEITID